MAQKPIAFFDIDGTFIRSALLIELTLGLVRHQIFPERVLEEIAEAKRAWVERRGTFERYILTVVDVFFRYIQGCNARDVARIGRMIAEEQRHQVYVFTRGLIETYRATHTLVAITGAVQEVVEPFLVHWGFARLYPSVLEVRDGRYTGHRTQNPSTEKSALVDRALAECDGTLVGSIGVGDTESDVGFLERVERPIAFNPNRNLVKIATERGWEMVIERKDTIVSLRDGRYDFR